MPDVFFYEAFEEEAKALRRNLPSDLDAGFDWQTIQECDHDAPPAPIVSIRTQSCIPVGWADRLSGVLARATGYDHLVAWLNEADAAVPCGHLPLYANRAVAEQAMLLWMALGRKLFQQADQFQRFHRDGLTGIEFEHKHLLVVGVGNIGSEIVKIGRGLDMDVRGVDIVERREDVDYVSIDEGLAWADVIVCAMNLTPGNVDFFDFDRLSRAKAGALFINIARGEQAPAADLLRLLEKGHLGGVALDVYRDEPSLAVALRSGEAASSDETATIRALADRPDVILTPHNAFNTREAVDRKAAQSIEQLLHFRQHGNFKWPVA